MRKDRNKPIFDEMCIRVTKCAPERYSTKSIRAAFLGRRVLVPLCVIGLTLMIAKTSDRNITQTSTQIAAILNFLLPFAVFAVHAVTILTTGKLLWFFNLKRGAKDLTPTVHTLLVSIVFAFPFTVFLEFARLQIFGTEFDFVRTAWISVFFILSWEMFAVYTVTTALTPAKHRFVPFVSRNEAMRNKTRSTSHGLAEQESRVRLCVTGCKPMPFGPKEAWESFWRPEFSLPIALVCICVTTGVVIAYAMNGQPWMALAGFHAILNLVFLLFVILSYVLIGWLLTESSWGRSTKRGPFNVHSLYILLPISFFASLSMEVAQIVLYDHVSIDISRFIVIGTLFTLISEACAVYLVSIAMPIIRAKNRVKAQSGGLGLNQSPHEMLEANELTAASEAYISQEGIEAAEWSGSNAADGEGYSASASEKDANLLLCVIGCKPFPLGYEELRKSFLRPEFFLPLIFLGLSVGTGIAATFGVNMQLWIWNTFVQMFLAVTGALTGVVLYTIYGWVMTKSRLQRFFKSSPPRIYSLSIVMPVCMIIAALNEVTFYSLSGEKEFQTSRLLQRGLIYTVLGELVIFYWVTLGIPMIRAKRQIKKRTIRSKKEEKQKHVDLESAVSADAIQFLQIRDRTVAADDLVMLNAEGNYIRVFERENSWLTNGPLFEILDALDYDGGIQVHRSTWVALSAFKNFKRQDRKFYLVLNDGTQVSVARGREAAVKEAIESYQNQSTSELSSNIYKAS